MPHISTLLACSSMYFGGQVDSNENGIFDDKEQTLLGQVLATWVATATDGDADGVDDACDLCPWTPAPAPSADGCP